MELLQRLVCGVVTSDSGCYVVFLHSKSVFGLHSETLPALSRSSRIQQKADESTPFVLNAENVAAAASVSFCAKDLFCLGEMSSTCH